MSSGTSFEVHAERVIDATGVWAADPEARFAAVEGAERFVPSRGSHIVIRRERLDAKGGVTLRIPGRVVFIIPWPGHWIIGTTDHADGRPPERISAPNDDVDELLETVNATMDVGLSREDIVGTYAGMRPLVGDPGGSTVKASREHRVTADASGLVRISGRQVHDVPGDGPRRRRRVAGPRRRGAGTATAELPLVGAAARVDLDRLAVDLALHDGLDGLVARRLVDRHGTEAREVLALGTELDLLRPLGPGIDQLEAEVAWAARRELATTIDDVLARRMRLVQELPDRGEAIAPRVAEILGRELGWDATRQAGEVDAYLEGARREYGVPWPTTR